MSNTAAGGWTPFSFELNADAKNVFSEATGSLLGVKYTAFAVATQVVAGVNYSFLAQAQVVAPNAPLRVVKLHVYQPLPGQGSPHVTQIVEITP